MVSKSRTIFRQYAILDPSVKWNELNPSLHASTVMTYQSGPSQCCSLCHEPDHDAANCALLGVQTQPPQLPPNPSGSSLQGGSVQRSVHLERICVSWNRGRCSFPICSFQHVCATCKRRGHRAKECDETPADSLTPLATPRPSCGQGTNGAPASSA